MKIRLESEGHSLLLRIPSGMLLNSITVNLISGKLEKQGIHIPAEQKRIFLKALRTSKSQLKGWKLLEAESADGDTIEIIL